LSNVELALVSRHRSKIGVRDSGSPRFPQAGTSLWLARWQYDRASAPAGRCGSVALHPTSAATPVRSASWPFHHPLCGFPLLRSRFASSDEGGPCGTFPHWRNKLRRGPHRAQFPSEFSLWKIDSAASPGHRFRFPILGRATLLAISVGWVFDRQTCQSPASIVTLALLFNPLIVWSLTCAAGAAYRSG
jgi:hypothetical protein